MHDTVVGLVVEGVSQYWFEALASLLLVALGWTVGRWRARRAWTRRDFLGRINISLNSFEGGKLLIRTIVEKPLDDVFINRAAVDRVRAAAQATSEQRPLLVLSAADRWPVLNCVLNQVSERFAEGHLRRDLGHPVKLESYMLCLTRERSGDVRTDKVRAMLIKKATLAALPEQPPAFEQPSHHVRFKTLQCLAELHDTEPDSFVELELVY
jgi:hypothetical protein